MCAKISKAVMFVLSSLVEFLAKVTDIKYKKDKRNQFSFLLLEQLQYFDR